MSVYKKILAVMQDVEYLQKDDQVAFGNTKYKAISEEKVTSTIRASLVKHGLVIIPVKQEHKKEHIGDESKYNYLTTVDVTYRIVDVETGDFIEAVSSGTGVDTQDKGVGKAMTYAYKYLLLRTFAIPTGEDPDKVSSAELDAKDSKKMVQENKSLEQCLPQLSNPITSKQVGLIKLSVEKLVGLGISKKDSFQLMQLEVGNFKKLEDLTGEQADRAIKQLDNLIAQNEKKGA